MVVTDHRGPASHAASTATTMLYDHKMAHCDDDVVLANDLRRRQDEQAVDSSFPSLFVEFTELAELPFGFAFLEIESPHETHPSKVPLSIEDWKFRVR